MIPKFSVKKPMTVLVAVILVVILGVVSFTRMTPDLMPEISVPYVVVFTSYAGASPEQVESTVTKPLEQSIATLDHVKGIQSTSSENYSIIMLEFSTDADLEAATMNIREKIGELESGWNDYVGTPTILKMSMDMLPISVVAVSRDSLDAIGISNFYEDTLAASMEGIEGVASVSATGIIEQKVKISLHQDKMDTVNEKVSAAIEKEFADGEEKIVDGKEDLADAWDQLIEGQEGIDEAKKALKTSKSDIEKQFRSMEKSLTNQLKQLQSDRNTLSTMIAGTEKLARDGSNDASIEKLPGMYSGLAQLDSAIAQLNTALNDLPDQKKKAIRSLYGADEKLADGEEQLADTRDTLSDTEEQLSDSEEQLADAKAAALESAKMDSLLSQQTVSGILSAENFSMPAGYADLNGEDWLIYVGDKLESAEELSNLILFDLGFDDLEPIRLADVAEVTVEDNADETYAMINGAPGLLVSFYKQSDYATATVSENIQKRFDTLSAQYEGLHFVSLMDQGDYIRLVISSVLENIAVGAALAIIILFLFLRDIRPTVVIACSIPISVTFAIVLMYLSGVTLNVISMAGLAVGVGMLVDNSIVVIENIYRLRKKGVPVVKACISGSVQVAGAITSSTLTTVCVFVPIVFVEGITRELFTDMALTIAYSLLASLVIALTLVPALSSGLLQKTRDKPDRFLDMLQSGFRKTLAFVLRFRIPAIILCVVLLVASFGLAIVKGFTFMPEMDGSEISVAIEMNDENATLADTRTVTDRIAARIQLLPEVVTCGAMSAGGATSMFGMSAAGDSVQNASTIYVVLDTETTGRSSRELTKVIEELCADQPCEATVSGADSMASFSSALGGSGVVVNIYGTNLDNLAEAAKSVAGALESMESVKEVNDGLGDTTPALRVTVDKEKAMREGLTVAQVFQYISGFLTTDATVTEFEDLRRDVVLEAVNIKPTIEDVKNKSFTFADREGKYKTVKLADIATFTETETLSNINRLGQRRYVTVSAVLNEGYNVTLESAAVQAKLASFALPAGCTIEYTGESETIMDAMADLMLMILLGIVIVYLIMVAQFQSLLSPFIVMATIPLAFTGGLIGLILCNMEISIVAMIGFVMLVGIIVNNGIVLIDAMNQLRTEGMGRREAVMEACVMRLRPVLMTALTTILGLVPLALGQGMGATLVQPVAVVSIGGLIYATFMTLYIVPALYDLVVKKAPRAIAAEDLEIVAD